MIADYEGGGWSAFYCIHGQQGTLALVVYKVEALEMELTAHHPGDLQM